MKNLGSKATHTLLLVCNKFWTSKMSLLVDWTKAMIISILKPDKHTELKWNHIDQLLLPQTLKKFLKE